MDENGNYPLPKRGKKRQNWDGEKIRALREHLGLTQRQMADELEVRQQTISEWETGFHAPHRSTQKTLSMVAERAGFAYDPSKISTASEESSASNTQTDD